MSEHLEQRLGDTMWRRADTVTQGPRFTADDITHAGRIALARRKAWRVGIVAVCVAAVLVVVGAVAATGRPNDTPPIAPPTLTPAPSISLGLDVLSGNVIQRPDGRRVTLALPAGVTTTAATRVPGGWVLQTLAGNGSALWFAPETGALEPIGQLLDSYEVSADGRMLVGAGRTSSGAPTVVAYELPSLRSLGQANFDSGMGPLVAGIYGDRVVLDGAQGSPGSSDAAVWNVGTGALRRTDAAIWIWGVSGDGKVLRRVDRHGPGGAKDITSACVDVVSLTDTVPTGQTGFCAPWLATPYGSGQISTGGTWAILYTATTAAGEPRTVLVRTADLHAGHWRPVIIDLPSGALPLFWDTDDTVILDGPPDHPGFYRCGTTGSCLPMAMPTDLQEPKLVPRRGG